ncbi:MAG TPA: hypothetical protein VMM37_06460 [Bacteroidota bacterium]|nr:hypothetical protein [Bacteroidota bacterium]
MKKSILAVGAGLVLGIVGARYLFVGSWLTLIPWTLGGLLIGYASSKNEAFINGVIFGFALAVSFLISGYAGQPSLISRIPIFLVLGAFGAIGGVVLALTGHTVRAKMMARTSKGKKS